MRRFLAVLLVAACGGGASQTKTDTKAEPIAPVEEPAKQVTEPAPAPVPPPKPKLTSDDFAKANAALTDAINAHDAAKITGMLAAGVTGSIVDSGMPVAQGPQGVADGVYGHMFGAFPDFAIDPVVTLVNGNHAASIVVLHGTNTGPMMGGPPSGKGFGLYGIRLNDFDEDGKVTRDDHLADGATLMMQLHPPKGAKVPAALTKAPAAAVTAVASGNDTEAKNLDVGKQFLDAFNKHDAKAAVALTAPDVVIRGNNEQKGPKQFTDTFKKHMAAFPDMKFDAKAQWAAGDFVVTEFTLAGTNTGAMPEMGIKKATKKPIQVSGVQVVRLDGGKVKEMYMFVNGGAVMNQLGLMPPAPPPAKK